MTLNTLSSTPALNCTDLKLRYPGQDLYAVGSATVGVSFSPGGIA